MSEPLTSSEIEDVLSSIRRLVSDEVRPKLKPASRDATGEKLLLTPALRVVQNDPVITEHAAEGSVVQGGDATDNPVNSRPVAVAIEGLDTFVTRVGAAVSDDYDNWENELGDPAILEPSQLQHAQEWEEFSARDAFDDLPFSQNLQPRDVFEEVISAKAADVFDAEILVGTAADAPLPGWAQTELDGIDDGASLSDSAEDADQPDHIEFVSLRSSAWADAAEASVIASLAAAEKSKGPSVFGRKPEPDPRSAEKASDHSAESTAPNTHDVGFNEDVLRELVRELIREELAGKLGERMTRNMRKLVRMELMRLLATQELEQ
jgi:hypothetical protein